MLDEFYCNRRYAGVCCCFLLIRDINDSIHCTRVCVHLCMWQNDASALFNREHAHTSAVIHQAHYLSWGQSSGRSRELTPPMSSSGTFMSPHSTYSSSTIKVQPRNPYPKILSTFIISYSCHRAPSQADRSVEVRESQQVAFIDESPAAVDLDRISLLSTSVSWWWCNYLNAGGLIDL